MMTRAIEEFPERTIWGALGRSGALWGDLGRFRVKRTKRAVRSYRFARKARTVSAGYARTRSLSPSFTHPPAACGVIMCDASLSVSLVSL